MAMDTNPVPIGNEPFAALERALIDEFLQQRGFTLASAAHLPPRERHPLLRQAAAYATGRLAQIEARAHFLDDID
jgi:hypothetical protein